MKKTEFERLSRQIGSILHGHGDELQGVVLADLVATWLAGHHPKIRDETKELWIDLVTQLVPLTEQTVLKANGVTSWDDLSPED